ncbi:MAG: acetylornithine deacetylase/succinyl-diaminopimelate desuccinylase-like protein [Paracoccaceae bacterium]|jgi:acetylornithine deacetylase/succinyl-diaminopimelate desuccinylase-like protein
MGNRKNAIKSATAWVETGGLETDLAHLVAIESESQRPESRAQLDRYLSEGILPILDRLGFTTKLHSNPDPSGGPFLTAERLEGDDLRTVLNYGHGDVVEGQRGRWAKGLEPFTLTRRADRLYGRGSADNKVQHLINLKALECVLSERGNPGFNVKILIEMGEEIGSPGLGKFIKANQDLLAADVLIASDGPRLQPDTPTVFMGSRGAINFSLSVELRDGANHSGNWGGLLEDPAIILAHALASITDARGCILVPEWRPDSLTPDIKTRLQDLPVGGGGPEISTHWGEPDQTPAERVFGWNSFTILAQESGVPDAPQNAISGTAAASCQLRFVVGTDEPDILPALRRHLDRGGFHKVKVIQTIEAIAPATRLDPDSPWAKFVAASLAKTSGKQPHVLPNLGGFIPNHVFSQTLGLPTIWVPHSYGGCSQHAPNEHVLVSVSQDAVCCMTGLFWDMAEAADADQLPQNSN